LAVSPSAESQRPQGGLQALVIGNSRTAKGRAVTNLHNAQNHSEGGPPTG